MQILGMLGGWLLIAVILAIFLLIKAFFTSSSNSSSTTKEDEKDITKNSGKTNIVVDPESRDIVASLLSTCNALGPMGFYAPIGVANGRH